MEINIWVLFGILIVHWIADFICQTDEMAKGKSSSWDCLLSHTGVYSLVWFLTIGSICIWNSGIEGVGYRMLVCFPIITFICHTATDYYTSRIVKGFFEKGDTHNGFVIIGLDQILHYVQLILTFYFLKG